MSTSRLFIALTLGVFAVSNTGCDKLVDLLKKDKADKHASDDDDDDDDEDDVPAKKKKKSTKKKTKKKADGKYLADSGFRPEKDGYNFKNTGGKFPLSPPVVTENVMVKLFGSEACENGNTKSCTLTPPAEEWAGMINRAMNGGQCEGMAVSSLTFFKDIDKPDTMFGHGAHGLDREHATPLIAYYWSYQALNPVMTETMKGRRSYTPNTVEDKLVEMFDKGQLGTVEFWGPPGHGGHAVTPYAVEDKGNGIHWIKIYDNNYPNLDRYITIDRNANTWKYDLAALNPDTPKMPWGGDADSHSIVVVPVDLRLKKAQCPFCRSQTTRKTVWGFGATVGVSDQEGRKVGIEGDKLINEIPDAEVVDLSAFLEGSVPVSPMFILPAENDYDVSIGGRDKAEGETDEKGVSVFGQGQAYTVEDVKVATHEKDTLSIPHEGEGVRYKTASGRMPSLKLAIDDEKEGTVVRVANMKADANSEVSLNLDRKSKKLTVQGGGKSTDGYDLKLKHVRDGGDNDEAEQKNIKFKLGDSHAIDVKAPAIRPKKGTPAAPIAISRGKFVPKLAPVGKDDKKDKDDKTRGVKPVGPTTTPAPPTTGRPLTPPAQGTPPKLVNPIRH